MTIERPMFLPLVPAASPASRRTILFGLAAAGVAAGPAVALPLLEAPAAPSAEAAASGLAKAVATPSPDAVLLQLADEYFAAAAEYRRLYTIYKRGRDKHQAKHPIPAALQVQPGDAELGLPEVAEHCRFGLSYVYRIGELEELKWRVTIEPPEGLQFRYGCGGEIVRYEPPSAAARARADEIIAAHDKWHAKYWRYPRELRSIERQVNRANKLQDRLRAKVDRTRAHTIAGLAVKARVAAIEGEDQADFADTTLASILRDMKALNGRARS